MSHEILVPLDGTQTSEAVLSTVEHFAKTMQAPVHIVRVVTEQEAVNVGVLAGMAGWGEFESARPPVDVQRSRKLEEVERYLDAAVHRLSARGLKATTELRVGQPAEEICKAARQRDVELIAMATHARAGVNRLAQGSVADDVVRRSGKPVLLVHG